ncbi:hypothetical protein HY383_02995 [Candidatus Daviesbacteria bacterium]|nr:hypothetical protein [Candidatus Daviesbacteria bacterium]
MADNANQGREETPDQNEQGGMGQSQDQGGQKGGQSSGQQGRMGQEKDQGMGEETGRGY